MIGPLRPAAEGARLEMAAVTKRFIPRFSAPAESDAVSYLVQFAVGGFNWNAPPHPKRPVFISWRVFDNNNGLIEFWLYRLAAFIIRDHQPT